MDSPLVTVLWIAVYHSLNKSKYTNWAAECSVMQFEILGFSLNMTCTLSTYNFHHTRWYHGKLSRDSAEKILSNHPNNSFLLRDSESIPGGYSLSIR